MSDGKCSPSSNPVSFQRIRRDTAGSSRDSQDIIVRIRDCGTIRGISVSPKNGMTEKLFVQTLIGRVLADDIYIGSRCIAARNQDIGDRKSVV